jgi:hypothetical protein
MTWINTDPRRLPIAVSWKGNAFHASEESIWLTVRRAGNYSDGHPVVHPLPTVSHLVTWHANTATPLTNRLRWSGNHMLCHTSHQNSVHRQTAYASDMYFGRSPVCISDETLATLQSDHFGQATIPPCHIPHKLIFTDQFATLSYAASLKNMNSYNLLNTSFAWFLLSFMAVSNSISNKM